MIHLTGTNGQTWRDFATKLSADHRRSISVADPSSKDLNSPEAEVIVFAECPASLIAGSSEDPIATLEEWRQCAGVLLALWRKNRERVVVLDWGECVADPVSFDQWLSNRIQTEPGKATGLLPTTRTSPAKRVIAEVIVAQDREATRLWNELRAASLPIAKDFDKLTGASPALALRELAHQQEETLKTHEMLLQEIQNAHKESEDFFEQLEIARADAEATKQELERTAALLQETQGTRQGLQDQLNTAQGELTALKQESQTLKESALRNHEMLLQEIQNAHKESEDFFEQWKSLEASAQPHYLTTERTLRGGEKHHPPHSHLDYVFDSASLFERHWRRLPVRLVEHNGNAGFAVFHPSGNGTTPLYHWEPNGQENGLDFMLFVPSDKKSSAKLVAAPTSDLLLVRDAAAKILGHLSVHGGPEAERWQSIARRLLQEVEEMPARLHYDSVAGCVHRENDKTSIRFNLANLYFRGRCARSFALEWTPASSGGTLRLDPSKEGSPILLSSASEIIVGFASTEEEEAVRKLWPRLTHHDRTFLLLLAKALPDFVFHLCEQHPDQKPNKERLTKQARTLFRRLRALDRKHRVHKAVAKLLRK